MNDTIHDETHTLGLKNAQALSIMKGKKDYDYLVSLLRLQNQEIVLVSPSDT
jgi:hypothetical protein